MTSFASLAGLDYLDLGAITPGVALTDPLLELEIGIVGTVVGGLVLAALLKLWGLPGKVDQLEQKVQPLEGLSGKVAKIEGELEVLIAFRSREPDVIAEVKKLGKEGSNPYSLDRRNNLLDQYQMGTITADEVGELSRYLQEDVDRLRAAGNVVGTVQATGVMLGLAAYLVAMQTATAIQGTVKRVRPPGP